MEYFIKGIKEYVNFSARAGRKDYWMFVLIYSVIYVALNLVDMYLGTIWLASIFSLFMFIPSVSYAARRLHDTGRSGWWQLLYLIPLIGLIIVIVFLAQKSDEGQNTYGEPLV